jgi:hypothetical protein
VVTAAAMLLVANAIGAPAMSDEIMLLKEQNQLLQKQLQSQQKTIDTLSQKVDSIQNNRSGEEPSTTGKSTDTSSPTFKLGNVDISGEAAAGIFTSEPNGQFSKGVFRIDEARLFLEAPVWEDVYFHSETDLIARESTSLNLTVGALYVDFEDVSKLWNREKMLNIRVGRFYTPFGEEYMNRYSMENPLISHSVSDVWGTDDGVELYGKIGRIDYVAAIQNGGIKTFQSFQNDKSIIGRIGADPTEWLHVSMSGMRTGKLSVKNGMTAIWFGNGFFRSLGSRGTTTTFHDNLVEADVVLNLPWGKIRGFGGYVNYGDNDSSIGHDRDVYYYSVEATHDFSQKFYSAARFSQIFAYNGFPVVANGSFPTYQNGVLTTDYWRLGLGLGYRLGNHLLLKAEYTFNNGKRSDGKSRNSENSFIMEAACNF